MNKFCHIRIERIFCCMLYKQRVLWMLWANTKIAQILYHRHSKWTVGSFRGPYQFYDPCIPILPKQIKVNHPSLPSLKACNTVVKVHCCQKWEREKRNKSSCTCLKNKLLRFWEGWKVARLNETGYRSNISIFVNKKLAVSLTDKLCNQKTLMQEGRCVEITVRVIASSCQCLYRYFENHGMYRD